MSVKSHPTNACLMPAQVKIGKQMHKTVIPFLVMLAACLVGGCDSDDDDESPSRTASSAGSTPSSPVAEYETIRDPLEDSFSVQVPRGWFNRAYTVRVYTILKEIVTCVSPNNDTVIFLGDTNLPQYWNPETANQVTRQACELNPMMKLETVPDAHTFFAEYVQAKFGDFDEFSAGVPEDSAIFKADLDNALAAEGIQAQNQAITLPFTYRDKGKPISAVIVGVIADFGPFWIPQVAGVSTSGNVDDYIPMLRQIALTKKANPEFQAKQRAIHEQKMAELRAQHADNMNWIQQSAQRHQQRMQALWAANDASVKNFYERSAASDLQHQRFLNSINGEHTVADSSGNTWQVDNSYQRYFVNKRDNSYIGGDIRLDPDELRRRGYNPDDYEEVKIRN